MNIDLLEGLAKATWTVAGAVGILGVFVLATGGMLWLWLKIGKWLAKYVHMASEEFREAFREVNGVEKKKVKS
jgi:hypothetical protein